MNKINPIQVADASEESQAVLEIVKKKLGRIPNMYKVMANSPSVVDAYVKLNNALSAGTIGSKMAEMIALATAEENTCSYCLSAHSFLGAKVGLSAEQILDARKFYSQDEKMNAGLIFVKKMLETPKEISSTDIEPLRKVGYTDGDILEIVANVIRNIFTNYINTISETEVDWPVVVKSLNNETK